MDLKIIIKIIGNVLLLIGASLVVYTTYSSGNHIVAVGMAVFYIFLASISIKDILKTRRKKIKTFLHNNEEFTTHFLQLASVVMLADGKKKEDEYDHVWTFLDKQYSNKSRQLLSREPQ